MANFFSASQEEQQEILLSFWDRFKYLVILALVTVILMIAGRDYYLSSSDEKDYAIASMYQSYLESNDKEIGEQILTIYPDTVYSDFVKLNEAKRGFESNDYSGAISLLKEVISNNPSSGDDFNPLQAAAKIRLAKIYLENEKYDSVLMVLDSSGDLTSTMYELKGDAENGLKEYQSARMSYMLALQNSTNQASRALINMKISDLEGEVLE